MAIPKNATFMREKGGISIYYDDKYFYKHLNKSNGPFDFEAYNNLRDRGNQDWMVKVLEWDYYDHIIVMERVYGHEFFKIGSDRRSAWRMTASSDQLWKVCMEWRARTVKAYFDFAVWKSQNDGPLHVTNQFFYHQDGRPHNVIMRDNKPVFVDPDGFRWHELSDFLMKQQEHYHIWWQTYVACAHRGGF
jgi:hypothetical protein